MLCCPIPTPTLHTLIDHVSRGCGLEGETKCAYLDFAIAASWGVVIPEVDEHQHSGYPAACDVRRDFDIYASVALGSGQKLAILRYNPDDFRVDGKTVRIATKERQRRLVEVLRAWVQEDPAPNLPFARFFMYYDGQSGSELPLVAQDWNSDEARVISSILPR